ncbi:hypothetical protein BV22DRAFT_1119089 [Leucogyrophana mollusca]|uniref:Uncharacterized protein n=1 Tax=Leucogyrophana mollusca TaxID=85980 RepID=A0ACB8BNN0_9AGAM|nr:hypothetical protein BV22DRAFT_1119089 [Leucogyrophana mollusca]
MTRGIGFAPPDMIGVHPAWQPMAVKHRTMRVKNGLQSIIGVEAAAIFLKQFQVGFEVGARYVGLQKNQYFATPTCTLWWAQCQSLIYRMTRPLSLMKITQDTRYFMMGLLLPTGGIFLDLSASSTDPTSVGESDSDSAGKRSLRFMRMWMNVACHEGRGPTLGPLATIKGTSTLGGSGLTLYCYQTVGFGSFLRHSSISVRACYPSASFTVSRTDTSERAQLFATAVS